mmetsp:Transcript_2995/g.6861  ORF Transcript_2995/g.6861 Transcript_2995/m.6861 type:complete len:218 (+) Transcript_2995:1151-1804(+)
MITIYLCGLAQVHEILVIGPLHLAGTSLRGVHAGFAIGTLHHLSAVQHILPQDLRELLLELDARQGLRLRRWLQAMVQGGGAGSFVAGTLTSTGTRWRLSRGVQTCLRQKRQHTFTSRGINQVRHWNCEEDVLVLVGIQGLLNAPGQIGVPALQVPFAAEGEPLHALHQGLQSQQVAALHHLLHRFPIVRDIGDALLVEVICHVRGKLLVLRHSVAL